MSIHFNSTDGQTMQILKEATEAYVKLLQHLNIPIMITAVTQVSEKEIQYELTISMPQGWEEDPAFLDLYTEAEGDLASMLLQQIGERNDDIHSDR